MRLTFVAITISFIASQGVQADLVHRYSFSGNADDSVGGAHGVLVNNTANAGFANGQLTLGNDGSQSSDSNNGDYVDLPNGIISALGNQATFEAWSTWNGPETSTWQRIFDFGTSDGGEDASPGAGGSRYLMFTTRTGWGPLGCRFGVQYPGVQEYILTHSAVSPVGVEQHIAITWDGANNVTKLYIDGVFSTQNIVPYPLTELIDNNNWLGRSQFNDEMLTGSINEFRIYDSALTAEQIAANYDTGPDTVITFNSASNLSPYDGQPDVGLAEALKWQSDDSPDIVAHNVYLGADRTAVETAEIDTVGLFKETVDAAIHSYSPDSLEMNTTYYWRIDEVGSDGQVVRGKVWSFTTVNLRASDPDPADEAAGVYTGSKLFWKSGKDADTHAVYMGFSQDNLIAKDTDLQEAFYQPDGLAYGTVYYWRVDETIADDTVFTGPVWSFTTQEKPEACLAGDLDGDCLVDLIDLMLFARVWLMDIQCSGFDCADLDQTDKVDIADFSMLARNWYKEETSQIVINEIHYHHDNNIEPVEFIELFNAGSRTANLSGWRLSGGLSYAFGENTFIVPGGYVVVGENPDAILTRFGVEALGPFVGKLSNEGERITLRDADDEKVDEVEYKNEFPWPISADGEGASMELINPSLDNDLAGGWRPSGYREPEAGRPPRYFLEAQSTDWHYRKGTSEPPVDWKDVDFVEDQTWSIGQTSVGYGDNDDNTVLTDMRNNYISVYLRHEFYLESPEDIPVELDLNIYVDDGCVVWINGQIVTSFHVTSDNLPYNAPDELVSSHEAGWETYKIVNPQAYLKVGANVIAIHGVNDLNGSSSDFSIDASLYAIYETSSSTAGFGPPSPGRINSVSSTNNPPQIRQVKHSPKQPPSNEPVVITAKVTDPDRVAGVTLSYQIVLPGHYIPAYLPVGHDALLVDPFQPRPVNPAFEDPANWTTAVMRDDGSGGDLFAGDDTYTVTLPAQMNRTLLRYRITAADTVGNSLRVPYFDDPSLNFALYVYDGVPPYKAERRSVHAEGPGHVYSSEILTSLPVYHVITREEDMWECLAYNGADQQPHDDVYEHQEARRAYNWEGAFVYEGNVYDHMGYRMRGANGRYYLAGKRSMKFRFNRGRYLQARDLAGKKYAKKWKFLLVAKMFGNKVVGNFGLAEILNMQLWNMVGVPASDGYWFHMRVIDGEDEAPGGTNGQYYGDFWGMFMAMENYDIAFIESRDLPRANLYKLSDRVFEGLRQLRYQGPEAVSDASDYENLRWNLNASADSQWIQDHLDCPEWYWYHAVSEAIRHYDVFSGPVGRHTMKNMAWYFYPDYLPENDYHGRLWFMPYDTDDTWGPFWNYGTDHAKVAIFEVNHQDNPVGPGKPELKMEYRNTIREFRDLVWQPDVINTMIDDLYSKIADFVPADRDRWKDAPSDAGRMDFGTLEAKIADMKTFAWDGGKYWPGDPSPYIGSAAHLDALASAEGEDDYIPKTPAIKYLGPSGYPVNRLVFETSPFFDPQGTATFGAFRWRVGEVTDESSPDYDPRDKRKFEIDAVWDSGEITENTRYATMPGSLLKVGRSYRVRCRAKDDTGRWSRWSDSIQFIVGEPIPEDILTDLRITEVMYNPKAPINNNDYEFIELKNIGNVNLDLSRVEFGEGITFQFAAGRIASLAPGAFVLVVRNEAAFESRYGAALMPRVAGEYTGGISDGGEKIVLQDKLRGVIVPFKYNDGRGWPQSADGAGHSLVPVSTAVANQNEGTLDYGGNWRASAYMHGSPGADDPVPDTSVVINEFAAHTDYSDPMNPDYDSNDWIELHNLSTADVTLTDWYLSDDKDDPKKWRIGDLTIPAGGFVSFDEINGFHNPLTEGFGLDKAGEEVVLSHMPGGPTDRIVDCIDYKGQDNSASQGRYPDGGDYWFNMAPSRDSSNHMPAEHVFIREIMYHPDADGEEYIELFNPTNQPVTLSGSAGPWRLDGQVDYTFPSQTVIASQGSIVIGVEILGSGSDDISNRTGRIALERPLEPDWPDTKTPWVIVDEVIYADCPPWPTEADGLGSALGRKSSEPNRSGNDPTNWQAVPPLQ